MRCCAPPACRLPEWLYEAGIGESRAALVEDDRILEALIEPEDSGPRLGSVMPARLTHLLPGRQGRLLLADGQAALIAAVPAGLSAGRMLTVEIVREALPEIGRPKPARAIVTDRAEQAGPDLLARITATGHPVRTLHPHQPDALEAAGWSELLEEAQTGDIGFAEALPGGALVMTPTPAMTLFDVDGPPPLEPLAIAAAEAVADAIRRHGIGGSIGIDFPTIEGKAARQAVTAAIDRILPPPFERTAMNGFGFVQIVRPRPRASLPERLRADPVAAAARAALRTLERVPPGSANRHRLPAPVLAYLDARPHWLAELARRTGMTPLLESL